MQACATSAAVQSPARRGLQESCDRLRFSDRSQVLRHFHSLSQDDLTLRFGSASTPEALDRYVNAIDFEADALLGIRDDTGAILALVELLRLRTGGRASAELAFSVVPSARGRGLASCLMQAAIDFAHRHGIECLLAQVCPRNAPMLATLRRAGMRLQRVEGEVVGVLRPTDEHAALDAAA
jgi:RimJ/RimL family protein N-acetyltransferase